MKIVIGCDHAGFLLKEIIKQYLQKKHYTVIDVGCHNENSCHYPEIATKLCTYIISPDYDIHQGILICGSGIGMSMKANRFQLIRCALCHNIETAELSRKHNNANVLALGSRILNQSDVLTIVDTFLTTPFENQPRHVHRINLL